MKALFIGRFQPFHNAHFEDIKLEIQEGYDVIIGIGSSEESNTKNNPFTFQERFDMIAGTLNANNIENYEIIPIPDVNDDDKWMTLVKDTFNDFDKVYTGSDDTERLFKESGYDVRKIKLIEGINATIIRERMIKGEDWQSLVPNQVREYLTQIKGVERVKQSNY